MARYQLPAETDINFTEGLDQWFIYIAGQVPYAIPMFLFSLFLVVALGGYYTQRREEGVGNMPTWATVGSFVTSTVASLMLLIDGLILVSTVVTSLALTLVCVAWLFFDRDRY